MGHDELSKPVEIDVKGLFRSSFDIISYREKTLTGNQDMSDRNNDRMRWLTVGNDNNRRQVRDDDVEEVSSLDGVYGVEEDDKEVLMIVLNPLEIKTFEVVMKKLDKGVNTGMIKHKGRFFRTM